VQGFFKRLPARTSAYATLYGRKRQPVPKLKASEIGGYLHDLGYLGGDRPSLGDAIAVDLKNLSADESLFKLVLVVTDGRDFADPAGEGPADFAAVANELGKAGVRLLLVSFPSPEADAEQSAKNLGDLAGPGAFYRAVEQPMELQSTLESLGQAVADLRRVQIEIPWAWRTFGGSHKVRIYLTTDGKRRVVELGRITLPAQTGRLGLARCLGACNRDASDRVAVPPASSRPARFPSGQRPDHFRCGMLSSNGACRRSGLWRNLRAAFPKASPAWPAWTSRSSRIPAIPCLQTGAGRRRFEEIRALLTQRDGEESPLHDDLFAALAEAITAETPARKAAESIAARLPDDQWGALSRLGLEELARALRQAGKRFPVLALPRSRGAVPGHTGCSACPDWFFTGSGLAGPCCRPRPTR